MVRWLAMVTATSTCNAINALPASRLLWVLFCVSIQQELTSYKGLPFWVMMKNQEDEPGLRDKYPRINADSRYVPLSRGRDIYSGRCLSTPTTSQIIRCPWKT